MPAEQTSASPPHGEPVSGPADSAALTSIILLCCNAVEYTRLCLHSVVRHTQVPYELVIVDNASSDGTPAFLDEVRTWPGPVRVEVLRNDTNRGFAAGCNQALGHAQGRFVVFLNNDTEVTSGWLEGLIGWAVQEGPAVGLVGPMSNYAPPPQLVEGGRIGNPSYDPGAIAEQRQREFAGRALAVERLTGFCLLARREALDQVGGFDERYGLGFFEDDDLCLRVREAGYRLLLAQNVFIHHHGSRTFAELGVDCQAQLRQNLAQFREKWGVARTAGYRAPAKVSLCMIVRNEEHNLPACLESMADLVSEIVIVDTGSTDRTREIALQFGARLFDFPWVDSFAAARNESLRHATGDWIFWLDADDRLDPENRHTLGDLFSHLGDDNVAFSMKCCCLPDPNHSGVTVVDHVRLFRNDPALRWRYRVHEQILPALRERDAKICFTGVVIHHVGYQDPAVRGRKLQRDLRLLQLENAEHPDDPFTLFNLGALHHELGRCEQALPFLLRSLERSHSSDSIVRKLYALIAQCHAHLGQRGAALVACRAGRTFCPDDAELLFQEAILLRELGERAAAIGCFLRLLHGSEGPHFASVDAGLRGYKARHNLAALYQEEGRLADAEVLWRQAVAEQPGFGPAWVGLAELLLQQARWTEFDEIVARLEAGSPSAIETAVLRAQGHMARKQYPQARQLLENTIAREPRHLWPRVILSHALLQEGRDWAGAEQALNAVLALDPAHAGARQNLEVLRKQQSRNGNAVLV